MTKEISRIPKINDWAFVRIPKDYQLPKELKGIDGHLGKISRIENNMIFLHNIENVGFPKDFIELVKWVVECPTTK